MRDTNGVDPSRNTTTPSPTNNPPLPPIDIQTRNRSNAIYQNSVGGNSQPTTDGNSLPERVSYPPPNASPLDRITARSRLYSA